MTFDFWKVRNKNTSIDLPANAKQSADFGASRWLKEDLISKRIATKNDAGQALVYDYPKLELFAKTPLGSPLDKVSFLPKSRGVICIRVGGEVDVFDYVEGL